MNPLLLCDFYKIGHRQQYAKGITQVWSNWTPRTSRIPRTTEVVNFGLTYFIKEYLMERFEKDFFEVPLAKLLTEYRDVIKATLYIEDPPVDHIVDLHQLGYLPIKIYSLPEGDCVPLNVPPVIITNTLPEFFWLPNYFETLLSCCMWKPSTSATKAREYRKIFLKHARRSGESSMDFVDWMGHDFSMRGMSGVEDAILSGMGHLTCFSGTDTIPAILAAKKYYGADLSCGGSVPATEHSVMSAGSQEGELETFRRLLAEVYPAGILSIVSDTWDLWKVLTEFIPLLKHEIIGRTGKLVIRPDSGDPVKIICGDPEKGHSCPQADGTLRLLARALGVDSHRGGEGGLPVIHGAGAIYGDSITCERADEILTRMVDELKLSPYNMVFGIGSYTYEYCTRDTHGWAMKATAVRKDGVIVPIFKKPVTDDGGKFSARGILSVTQDEGRYCLHQNCTEEDLNSCCYNVVFSDGRLWVDPSFNEIRKRVRAGL